MPGRGRNAVGQSVDDRGGFARLEVGDGVELNRFDGAALQLEVEQGEHGLVVADIDLGLTRVVPARQERTVERTVQDAIGPTRSPPRVHR